jgi:hypothetical protein
MPQVSIRYMYVCVCVCVCVCASACAWCCLHNTCHGLILVCTISDSEVALVHAHMPFRKHSLIVACIELLSVTVCHNLPLACMKTTLFYLCVRARVCMCMYLYMCMHV